jgi:D-xylose transport system permease protein
MGFVALIFFYVTTNTKFGRYSYALGGNLEATRLSGINTKRPSSNFLAHGLMTGVSGIVLTGYVAAGTVGGGQNYELKRLLPASSVHKFCGRRGTIVGALVGALIMSSLLNGMSVMNMQFSGSISSAV